MDQIQKYRGNKCKIGFPPVPTPSAPAMHFAKMIIFFSVP